MPTGLYPIWPQHLTSVSSLARGSADHPQATGNSTTAVRVPRWGSPLHSAQEGRAGFVVESDDNTGGRQVHRVGHRWATKKGAERSEGSCGSVLGAELRLLFVHPAAPGIPLWGREGKPEARMWVLPLHTHAPPCSGPLEPSEGHHRLGELPMPGGLFTKDLEHWEPTVPEVFRRAPAVCREHTGPRTRSRSSRQNSLPNGAAKRQNGARGGKQLLFCL